MNTEVFETCFTANIVIFLKFISSLLILRSYYLYFSDSDFESFPNVLINFLQNVNVAPLASVTMAWTGTGLAPAVTTGKGPIAILVSYLKQL